MEKFTKLAKQNTWDSVFLKKNKACVNCILGYWVIAVITNTNLTLRMICCLNIHQCWFETSSYACIHFALLIVRILRLCTSKVCKTIQYIKN